MLPILWRWEPNQGQVEGREKGIYLFTAVLSQVNGQPDKIVGREDNEMKKSVITMDDKRFIVECVSDRIYTVAGNGRVVEKRGPGEKPFRCGKGSEKLWGEFA